MIPVSQFFIVFAAVFLASVCSQSLACGDCDSCKTKAISPSKNPTLGASITRSSNQSYADWRPVTPQPTSSSSFRFGVLGDTQGLQYVEQLITDMNEHDPELVVFPGDLVGTGSPNTWGQWNALTSHFVGGPDRRLMVPGNHDLPVGGDAAWQQAFPWLPSSQNVGGEKGIDQMDYFVDFGDSRFISVTTDSQAHGAGGQPAAQQWLENVLNDPATQAKDHVFVYSHHPITFNNYDRTGGTAGDWWQSMGNAGNVRGVFVGHWHQYQPSQPHPHHDTWEVISGTGNSGFSGHPWQNKIGYSIVEVEGPRVTLNFYGDANGDGQYDDLLDSFRMADSRPGPAGVVAYYGFEDSLSNRDTALSDLAKQNHGTYFGNASIVEGGAIGRALSLDGNGDFANGRGIGDYNLAILNDLTISIQANYSSLQTGNSANTLVSYTADVAGYTDREEAVNQPFNLRIRSDRRLELFWERDNNTKVSFVSTTAADVQPDEWNEYRVTRDADDGQVTFYVNGTQLGDSLAFNPTFELPTGGAQGILRVGINYNRDRSEKLIGEFQGLVDELAIWNQVTLESYRGPTPGDLNIDGAVDESDITLFIDGWMTIEPNQPATVRWMLGDLDLDGSSSLEDLVIFQRALRNVGLTFPGLPEPSSCLLFLIGIPMVLARNSRRP